MTNRPKKDLTLLQQRLLHLAGKDLPRYDFFSSLLEEILQVSGYSSLGLLLRGSEGLTTWEADQTSRARLRIASLPEDYAITKEPLSEGSFTDLCLSVLLGTSPTQPGRQRKDGAFFHGSWPILDRPHGRFASYSVAVLPLSYTGGNHKAVLGLRMLEPRPFTESEIDFLLELSETVSAGLTHHLVQWALRERVKELTCLYGVSSVTQRPSITEDEALQHIADLLPSGWQYPEIASAIITIDGKKVAVSGEGHGDFRQMTQISIGGQPRGTIEIVYSEERPPFNEGPFLQDERNLLEQVAVQIGSMLESRQAARQRFAMEEQFRETARLATIGKLVAGTAHELNEPLGAILGFAQLSRKQPHVPKAIDRDLKSIIKASLHARDIIRKLLLFSRQAPPKKIPVSVNSIIKDALQLLRAKLENNDIEVKKNLQSSLPKIRVDPSQIQQVLINLIINALHAMPRGGTLRIESRAGESKVEILIADTGIGMSQEVMEQAFMPFFTTKDIGQGTGLGLSVVHGIVTSHEGEVEVESQENEGTQVIVTFPFRSSLPSNICTKEVTEQ